MNVNPTSVISTALVPPAPSRVVKNPPGAIDASVDAVTSPVKTISAAPIEDSISATAAIQGLRQIFSAQPSVAMLAQANPMPENALRLLQ